MLLGYHSGPRMNIFIQPDLSLCWPTCGPWKYLEPSSFNNTI